MTAGHPAAAPSIRHVIAVPDLDDVGSDSAAGALGSTVPRPAIFGDEAASACAEGKIFPVTERNGGRIVAAQTATGPCAMAGSRLAAPVSAAAPMKVRPKPKRRTSRSAAKAPNRLLDRKSTRLNSSHLGI